MLLGILIRPEAAIAGSQRAMGIWCTSVAPSLFPFLALLPILTGPEACAAYNSLLSGFMRRLFHLPGAAAPALVTGMISGSPGGALALRSVVRNGGMSAGDARRLGLAVCGVSPAYLILGVGVALYGDPSLGISLAAVQLAIQLALLMLLRGILPEQRENLPALHPVQEGGDGMRGAVERALVICGYMVLFGAIGSVIASFAGSDAGLAVLLLTDLPSGLAELSMRCFPGKMLLQGTAIGFGGLCIAAQNLDVLREIGVRSEEYLAVRGVAAALFGCLSGVILRAREANHSSLFVNTGLIYAFSLAIAALFAVPGLIFLSKELFLNKEKSAISAGKS